ncbi:MAG: alpha/beta hydrolase [Flavobacteriaceae bacterium]|nr:alpha/beta hydrolase [Flavobacteriaceae bacterium]
MKILYLHGLDSQLSAAKRTVLSHYGKVLAPTINYQDDSQSAETLVRQFGSDEINVVIGSSMGGFAGFYVSEAFRCPALLFNPALAHRSVLQKIPTYATNSRHFKQFVLGAQDEVVDPKATLRFIADWLSNSTKYDIHLHPDLAHRIPIAVFESEIANFFSKVSQNVQ